MRYIGARKSSGFLESQEPTGGTQFIAGRHNNVVSLVELWYCDGWEVLEDHLRYEF